MGIGSDVYIGMVVSLFVGTTAENMECGKPQQCLLWGGADSLGGQERGR